MQPCRRSRSISVAYTVVLIHGSRTTWQNWRGIEDLRRVWRFTDADELDALFDASYVPYAIQSCGGEVFFSAPLRLRYQPFLRDSDAIEFASYEMAPPMTFCKGPMLTDGIDRYGWDEIGSARYYREYVLTLRPVIIRGAFDHWPARRKWNLHFLRNHYKDLPVTVGGSPRKLGEFIEEVLASAPNRPAPYLHNHPMDLWPAELQAEVSPMPDCTRPNWLESRWFPSRKPLTYIEAYIGGPGAKFPVLHYDGLHTHAFLMQIEGVKEYVAFPPDSERFVYPLTIGSNVSKIDVENPDFNRYPLFSHAAGLRFQLYAGETLFVPAGWWHTARILTPSITISINGVNASNCKAFCADFYGSKLTVGLRRLLKLHRRLSRTR